MAGLHRFGDSLRRRSIQPSAHAGPRLEPLEPRTLLSGAVLDTSFGTGGFAINDFPGSTNDLGETLLVNADQTLIAVGRSVGESARSDISIAKYRSNGSLDPTFGDAGRIVVHAGATGLNLVADAALDLQGRIVVLVRYYHDSPYSDDILVARFTADGAVDTTFGGGDGFIISDFGNNEQPVGVAIDASGRIVVGGNDHVGWFVARYGESGQLDSGFGGGDGWTHVELGLNIWERGGDVAIDSTGRIVVAGDAHVSSLGWELVAARLDVNGELDPTFGVGGRFHQNVLPSLVVFGAMTLDASGRVLIAGPVDGSFSTRDQTAVVRITAAGTLDTSFGSSGVARLNLGAGQEIPTGLAVDASGRVLVAGSTDSGFSRDHFLLARFTIAGVLDTTLAGKGYVVIDFGVPLSDDAATSVAVDASGRILALGVTAEGSLDEQDFAMARYTANGSLDATFGIGGRVITEFQGPGGDFSDTLLSYDDGRFLVVGGAARRDGGLRVALTRYEANGTLDSSFGAGGRVVTELGTLLYNEVTAAVVDNAGRIVVGGYVGTTTSAPRDLLLLRYNPDGTLDGSFGTGGIAISDLGASEVGRDLAIDSQGRIIVGGYRAVQVGNPNLLLARYTIAGALDTSFGTGGFVDFDIDLENDVVSSVVIDAFDRPVVGGHTEVVNSNGLTSTDMVIARFTSAGVLDTSFAGVGYHIYGVDPSQDLGGPMVMTPGGDFILAGRYQQADPVFGTGFGFGMARFDAQGNLVASFGDGGIVRTRTATTMDLRSIQIDAHGRVLLAGQSTSNGNGDLAFARYSPKGVIDLSLDLVDGMVTADLGFARDVIQAMVFDAQGRLLIAGETDRTLSGTDQVVARYLLPQDPPPPTADSQSISVLEDGSVTGQATAQDPQGDPLSYSLADGPLHGILTFNADGSFVYAPALNYFGSDSFNFKASDGVAESGLATVSITVTPVNDVPLATDDAQRLRQDAVLTIAAATLLGNDSDIDGDALTVVIAAGPAHGTLTWSLGNLLYTPQVGYFGPDSFTYRASDGVATSNLATVSLDVVQFGAPSNFTGSVSGTSVTLSWVDNGGGFTDGFYIERASKPKGKTAPQFRRVSSVPATQTTWTNIGVSKGEWWYRVRAFDGSYVSAYSDVVTASVRGKLTVTKNNAFSTTSSTSLLDQQTLSTSTRTTTVTTFSKKSTSNNASDPMVDLLALMKADLRLTTKR